MNYDILLPEKSGCQFCDNEAKYDAKTKMGCWAFMCEACYQRYGIGLGIGKGGKLRVAK